MGLTYEETELIPLSELLDLISIHQIKTEGFKYKKILTNEEDLMRILSLR